MASEKMEQALQQFNSDSSGKDFFSAVAEKSKEIQKYLNAPELSLDSIQKIDANDSFYTGLQAKSGVRTYAFVYLLAQGLAEYAKTDSAKSKTLEGDILELFNIIRRAYNAPLAGVWILSNISNLANLFLNEETGALAKFKALLNKIEDDPSPENLKFLQTTYLALHLLRISMSNYARYAGSYIEPIDSLLARIEAINLKLQKKDDALEGKEAKAEIDSDSHSDNTMEEIKEQESLEIETPLSLEDQIKAVETEILALHTEKSKLNIADNKSSFDKYMHDSGEFQLSQWQLSKLLKMLKSDIPDTDKFEQFINHFEDKKKLKSFLTWMDTDSTLIAWFGVAHDARTEKPSKTWYDTFTYGVNRGSDLVAGVSPKSLPTAAALTAKIEAALSTAEKALVEKREHLIKKNIQIANEEERKAQSEQNKILEPLNNFVASIITQFTKMQAKDNWRLETFNLCIQAIEEIKRKFLDELKKAQTDPKELQTLLVNLHKNVNETITNHFDKAKLKFSRDALRTLQQEWNTAYKASPVESHLNTIAIVRDSRLPKLSFFSSSASSEEEKRLGEDKRNGPDHS